MQNLNVAIVQTKLFWENVDANLQHFESIISKINDVDLIVLPETFSTGFTMNPEQFAKESIDKALPWMIKNAKEKNTFIAASIIAEDNGQYFNRLLFVSPDGSFHHYNKKHLFTMGDENNHYTAGKDKVIVECKGFNICLQICYDLRFPVFVRNLENYDAILYVANWPAVRDFAWRSLLISRAIENQSYVIACNRIGQDAKLVDHIGNSGLIDFKGEAELIANDDCVIYKKLNKQDLNTYRNQFPVLNDRDHFHLI